MIYSREPNNVNESLRKYKLQPLSNTKASACPKEGESLEMSVLKQEAGAGPVQQENVNSIRLVESTMVTMGEPEETDPGQSGCNSQSRDWLCWQPHLRGGDYGEKLGSLNLR